IKPLLIEAKKGNRMPAPWGGERAGAFVSGGLDSLAMLKANRNRYPPEHPRYIRDGLIVHGFDIGGRAAHDAEAEAFEQALDTLSAVAADAGLTLIPVRTNVRHLDDNVDFWIHEFDGAALASVAHAFSNRLSTISVASGHEVPDIEYGDSPVLMANYSSTDLLIRLENLTLSRLARASLIAEWDVALKNLRVCTLNPPGRLNCGQCEKCIRTMTELVALGKLTETEAFGVYDVSVDLLETVESTEPNLEQYFRELIEPLEQRGRHDLAAVIERKLSEYERHLAWQEERDWKGVIKRFDRKRLGSSLFRAYSAIRSLRREPVPARTRVKA
ncbi:MAG: hypothetical protein GX620_02340, partial [Chloroflexi bacterium]|nr:hypothetical protein [Chloroflexota bacterium]